MTEWTTALVEDRLELAADVFRALPGVKPQGHFNAWPEYVHSFADKVGQQPRMRRPLPGPRQITQAEETLLWLRWLEDGGWASPVAAGQPHPVETDLLGDGSEPHGRDQTLAVRAGGDHLAAQRAGAVDQTIAGVRDRKRQPAVKNNRPLRGIFGCTSQRLTHFDQGARKGICSGEARAGQAAPPSSGVRRRVQPGSGLKKLG